MTTATRHNHDTYCYLKQQLEPQFTVVAEPQAGYFAQWKFCYRIFDGQELREELTGDFRDTPAGSLVKQAEELVQKYARPSAVKPRPKPGEVSLPIASRLPPLRDSRTWFSSGRAAYAWLLREVVRPKRVFLPTYICWSLVDVMLHRFPNVPLEFYSVDKDLGSAYPYQASAADAVVDVHYFGHRSSLRHGQLAATVLEDCSHCLLGAFERNQPSDQTYRFGSLRKAYRVADGGFVDGQFCPQYEADARMDAWLRLNARDWRDLREAENMVDRTFCVSDISSQSLATILTASSVDAHTRRQANNAFLDRNFPCGRPLQSFADNESPLLHNRCFESSQERDSLREFLLSQQIFTSIHWPVHEHLRQQQDQIDIEGAVWLQDHTFAIPVAPEFGEREMNVICDASTKWQQSGASRFPHLPIG